LVSAFLPKAIDDRNDMIIMLKTVFVYCRLKILIDEDREG